MRTSQRFFLKKCTFFSSKVIFLGFVVLAQGVEADLDKIKAIIDWPLPKTIHEIWFSWIGHFYLQFRHHYDSYNGLYEKSRVQLDQGSHLSI